MTYEESKQKLEEALRLLTEAAAALSEISIEALVETPSQELANALLGKPDPEGGRVERMAVLASTLGHAVGRGTEAAMWLAT